jgi:membrane-bound ClpP family serine protease
VTGNLLAVKGPEKPHQKARRSEQAVDVAMAVACLVAASGAVLIVVSLLLRTRATVPALGLILFIVGLLLATEFGIRPALRQQRSPLHALFAGLRRLGSTTIRLVRGR